MDYRNNIQNSIDYIENNLSEKIELNSLAKRSYFSQFHFHRLFHKFVGESIMDYVRKRRLSEAAKDLKVTDLKINEIALFYQFNSQESFSRAFKKNYGITPREYRKTAREIAIFKKAHVLETTVESYKSINSTMRMAA